MIHGRLHFSGNCDITRCEYCVIDSIDRGWFYRHHYICQEKGCSKDELSNDMYNLLMVYSILCGAGWIACGVLSCLGSMRMSKALTLVSGIIFVVLFLIFIVMFGPFGFILCLKKLFTVPRTTLTVHGKTRLHQSLLQVPCLCEYTYLITGWWNICYRRTLRCCALTFHSC